MGYLGRRIGLSQDQGDSNPGAANGAVGGGLLDLFAHGYFERQGDIYNAPGSEAQLSLTATGGVISDYADGSDVYRAHVFTSTGTFDVSALSENISGGNNIDYLVVAGGGGGSDRGNGAGGGGAGGLLSTHPDIPSPTRQTAFTTAVRTYTMTVGGGGGGATEGLPTAGDRKNRGMPGSVSSITYPGPVTVVTTTGGGAGGQGNTEGPAGPPASIGDAGGSGGGGDNSGAGGAGTNYPGPTQQGFPGGTTPGSYNGGAGGGGAGAVGEEAGASGCDGGAGLRVRIAGPLNNGVGASGPGSEFAWFAGGGGGGRASGSESDGGYGGGGKGAYQSNPSPLPVFQGRFGVSGTGGGGGSGADGTNNDAGSGGSGVIIVRYKIGTVATAKATGGSVSYYNNKTVHVFTSSGTFETTANWSSATVEYVVIGGGGGAGFDGGGGGGAGAWREGTTPIGSHPVSTTIQIGAGGIGSLEGAAMPATGGANSTGTPSYFGSPITAPGGGGGGGGGGQPGAPGGSGGGGRGGGNTGNAASGTGDPSPGTPGVSPSNGWGNDGGNGDGPGGGGGGAGGTGFAGNDPTPSERGVGGVGLQLPTTYKDPKASYGFSGPSPGGFWFAGGGGGGSYPLVPAGIPGGGVGGPYAGAGDGQGPDPAAGGTPALANSGSGGGGGKASSQGPNNRSGGDGGSGIVLIAYPS